MRGEGAPCQSLTSGSEREHTQRYGSGNQTLGDYLRCARAFAAHYRISPVDLGAKEVHDYLLHLTRELHYSPTNLKMHVAALKFLYGVTLNRPDVVERIPYPKESTVKGLCADSPIRPANRHSASPYVC